MTKLYHIRFVKNLTIFLAITLLLSGVAVSGQVTITVPEPNAASKWSIYELSFDSDESVFANPFWDVTITGIFTGPSSQVIKMEGFYFDTNTWKLRFSPTQSGIWNYSVTFHSNAVSQVFNGSMECLPAQEGNHGFINISDSNPYRFMFSDSTYMIVNGINGHTPGVTAAVLGIPNGPYPADSLMTEIMWQYLASKNINAYRLQMFHQTWAPPVFEWNPFEGCANLLYNSGGLDRYDVDNARLIDKWLSRAAQNGVNLYPCLFTIHEDLVGYFFNQSPWSVENGGYYTNPTNMYTTANDEGHEYVKKYVRYVVNRYAAFRNIIAWEYNNEWGKYTSADWLNSLDTVITNSDPYGRAHVESYWGYDYSYDSELHDLASNEIVDFHVYPLFGYTEFNMDSLLSEQIFFFYEKYEKPINIGEFGSGNYETNIPPEGHYFDRIGYWTAFVSGGSALYWLRGDNSQTGIQYNMETFDWMNSFHSITSNIRDYKSMSPVSEIFSMVNNNSEIRAHGIGNTREYMFYFNHYTNHTSNTSNEKINLTLPDESWVLRWFDPTTGALVSSGNIDVTTGSIELDIPDFNVDLALYLYTDAPVSVDNRQKSNEISAFSIAPNPIASSTNITFGLPERSVVKLTVYDLFGKSIITLADKYLNQGLNTITWNGVDENSRKVQDGIYILKLEANGIVRTGKLIIAR